MQRDGDRIIFEQFAIERREIEAAVAHLRWSGDGIAGVRIRGDGWIGMN
jgi:hypothetical protein